MRRAINRSKRHDPSSSSSSSSSYSTTTPTMTVTSAGTSFDVDSVACSPVFVSESSGSFSFHGRSSLRLPSLNSSACISSSNTAMTPLSKMFTMPSKPSMRRLVPSPSMPSLRIDLRSQRSRSDLCDDDHTSSSSGSTSIPSSASTVTVTTTPRSNATAKLPPVLRRPSTALPESSKERDVATSFPITQASVSSSTTNSARSRLDGARQKLFNSARRKLGTPTGPPASSKFATATAAMPSDSSVELERGRKSPFYTSTSVMNAQFWQQPQASVLDDEKKERNASPISLITDIPAIASPTRRVFVTSVRRESQQEDRRDSTSTQTTMSSPPMVERILPPEEMIATIDRIRNEQRAAAAANGDLSSGTLGEMSFGLGLSGVTSANECGTGAQQHSRYHRNRLEQNGHRPSTSLSIDESFSSSFGSSHSPPLQWTDDDHYRVAAAAAAAACLPAPLSPTMMAFSPAQTSNARGSTDGRRSALSSDGRGTPSMLEVTRVSSPALSASPNMERSLPVPLRLGNKKSRSFANGLNTAASSGNANSTPRSRMGATTPSDGAKHSPTTFSATRSLYTSPLSPSSMPVPKFTEASASDSVLDEESQTIEAPPQEGDQDVTAAGESQDASATAASVNAKKMARNASPARKAFRRSIEIRFSRMKMDGVSQKYDDDKENVRQSLPSSSSISRSLVASVAGYANGAANAEAGTDAPSATPTTTTASSSLTDLAKSQRRFMAASASTNSFGVRREMTASPALEEAKEKRKSIPDTVNASKGTLILA